MGSMKDELTNAVAAACKDLFGVDVGVELTRPDEQFGDYAANVALQLSKKLGKNPREIGEALADKLRGHELLADVQVAGPGFLNFRLTDAALLEQARRTPQPESGEVVIETNNPNPFKAMHIGHAFNAILADTIANLLKISGKTTHRVSYHGDVGAHVGKSMYSLLKYVDGNPDKLNEIPLEEHNTFMSRMYAEGAKAYKEDEHAKAEINKLAEQSFSREDPVYAKVYETCKAWSFEQIDAIVARMGNKPIEKRYLESEADKLGVQTVQQHKDDVFVESDGALVFPGSKYGSFDNVFVSSIGRGLYGARDLGLMQLKAQDFPSVRKSYIVTAEEQRDYFVGVIKAAELALPELKGVTTNISTGTVKLSTGKMSSRSGDVVEIGWLFDQIAAAVEREEGAADEYVIAGALRYEFLRVRIGSDVIFDIDEAVSVKGNSGPYLQYAHARARSILNKTDAQPERATELEADERSLLRKIGEYSEVVEKAGHELMPHYVCTYLYELAQTFNRFYEKNRVIDDPRQNARLQLVTDYADTLKNGLEVLGIHAPEKM
jgi:arginyl-tRNA synthetase